MNRIARRIKTRGYELDTSMTVPPSTLLRYLEHMRWESAHDPAVCLGEMFRDGYRMVVRAQQLEIDEPPGLEQDLDVSLVLGHIGRASMDMHHDVVRVADGKLLARGVVTAVYLDPSGHPHAIPGKIRELVATTERLTLLPAPVDPAPTSAWARSFAVAPSDLDLFQHVNHARYLDYFNDTRLLAAAARGYGKASETAGRRLARAALDYRRQAVLGDELRIATWADTDGVLAFEMQRASDGEVLARCRIEPSR